MFGSTLSRLRFMRMLSMVFTSIRLWFIASIVLGTLVTRIETSSSAETVRKTINFNRDWTFSKGDHPDARLADFDDSTWEAVHVPHDWAISGPFDPEADGFAAKLPWKGIGWYRKRFTLDKTSGKRFYLDFDGVMAFPQVYVNGQLAGEWDYGYTSFRIDATPFVKAGKNTIAVRADTTRHGTRWYPGAGIYRKVVLEITESVHLGHWGVYATTPQISEDNATVQVEATIENHNSATEPVSVEFSIASPAGEEVAAETVDNKLDEGTNQISTTLSVSQPQRWDVASPHLYTLHTRIQKGEHVVDERETPLGFRTYKLTADDGFHLNGRRLQIYGVNLHHDLGPLGAAFNRRAMERQLEIMQEMGVNAIRTSHNPPAPELLELCDKMGMIVWDECFDKWNHTAGRHDGQPPMEEFGERQIRSLVMRDRNHPSVVVWSIANEISEVGGHSGLSKKRVAMMRDFVLEYDDTRPVGIGHHIPEHALTDFFEPLDFVGWNYERRYGIHRERFPEKPIIYSESASTLSTRGFYDLPLPKTKIDYSDQHQVSSYDYNSAVWSDIPDAEFKLMEQDEFVAGEFVWTGFDYLGEPTPYNRIARSSYFGIVDLCGIPKDRYYLYRSYWRPDTTTVHILPHWNLPERVGQKVPVFVYTNGDSAELFLNDRSLGRKSKSSDLPEFENLAVQGLATASSQVANQQHTAQQGNDGTRHTFWKAARNEVGQWWQVDLGTVKAIEEVIVHFPSSLSNYLYEIQVSRDGETWQTAYERTEYWDSWGDRPTHALNTEGRFLRVEFTGLKGRGTVAGLREVIVYPTSYYKVCEKYRLQWFDVTYEPGQLKAVAYRNGHVIGESIVQTAEEPSELRLTADRNTLNASGEDLSFVTIEAFDKNGILCPLADNRVEVQVTGMGKLESVGNGNPLSLDSFKTNDVALFYGKALAIVRAANSSGGEIHVKASSEGLTSAAIVLETNPQ